MVVMKGNEGLMTERRRYQMSREIVRAPGGRSHSLGKVGYTAQVENHPTNVLPMAHEPGLHKGQGYSRRGHEMNGRVVGMAMRRHWGPHLGHSAHALSSRRSTGTQDHDLAMALLVR